MPLVPEGPSGCSRIAGVGESEAVGGLRVLLRTPFEESNAEVSPDGRWLAYQSNESGRDEVYVRPFPDVGRGPWQVSTEGGKMPLWARSGDELFYRLLDGAVVAVGVESGTVWRNGRPTQVVPPGYFFGGEVVRAYDVSAPPLVIERDIVVVGPPPSVSQKTLRESAQGSLAWTQISRPIGSFLTR